MSGLPGNSTQFHDVKAGTMEMRCYERGCEWIMREPANDVAAATRKLAKSFREHYRSVHPTT